MSEPRRRHQLIFHPVGRRPMPTPYPWVEYRTRDELRAAVARAARFYWPAFTRADVTSSGSDWRECRGQIYLTLPGGAAVDARFVPVFDPNRPAEEQARRPEGAR